MMAKEELWLEDCIPLLCPYPLKYEVGMVVVFLTLSLSLRTGRYVGHI